jgi:Fe/S biogenesis protein NfuA
MDPVIRVTPAALEIVREALGREQDRDDLALWLEVDAGAQGAYSYDLWFGPAAGAALGDAGHVEGDVRFIVPAGSVARLRGAVLDAGSPGGEPGLVIVNPNAPPLEAVGPPPRGDLIGPVAKRVQEVLTKQVNPFLAAHGGHVELVGVVGPIAHVELSGGCQGCGLARATLRQGIAVAITEAVSEVTEVIDVTDHLSGLHPYLEADLTGRAAR